MDLSKVDTIYFLGVGGIGMSALARYFVAQGYGVLGYDRVASSLTHSLEHEGVVVEYGDDLSIVSGLDVEHTLVVRTPAVPDDQLQELFPVLLPSSVHCRQAVPVRYPVRCRSPRKNMRRAQKPDRP
jgi:UDP-N-acetylmuramate-alanine ligase